MYEELLCHMVAVPKEHSASNWRDWCRDISDTLIDRTIELARPTLVSDALLAHVNAILYDIPAGIWGKDIKEITSLDVFDRIMSRVPEELFRKLGYWDGWHNEPQEKLAKKFKDALDSLGIDCIQWCIMFDIPILFVKPWLECGAKLGCKKLVIEWLKMDYVWPIEGWQRIKLECYR